MAPAPTATDDSSASKTTETAAATTSAAAGMSTRTATIVGATIFGVFLLICVLSVCLWWLHRRRQALKSPHYAHLFNPAQGDGESGSDAEVAAKRNSRQSLQAYNPFKDPFGGKRASTGSLTNQKGALLSPELEEREKFMYTREAKSMTLYIPEEPEEEVRPENPRRHSSNLNLIPVTVEPPSPVQLREGATGTQPHEFERDLPLFSGTGRPGPRSSLSSEEAGLAGRKRSHSGNWVGERYYSRSRASSGGSIEVRTEFSVVHEGPGL